MAETSRTDPNLRLPRLAGPERRKKFWDRFETWQKVLGTLGASGIAIFGVGAGYTKFVGNLVTATEQHAIDEKQNGEIESHHVEIEMLKVSQENLQRSTAWQQDILFGLATRGGLHPDAPPIPQPIPTPAADPRRRDPSMGGMFTVPDPKPTDPSVKPRGEKP